MSLENEDKLSSINCSSCGGNLTKSTRIYYDDEEEEDVEIPIAKCLQCGTEYDQHTKEYYSIFADELTYDKDNTIFKLGIKGIIEDVEYEIIGRIRYQEEEEYEKATWDEWVAISGEGSYYYFVEENGKVIYYTDYIPESIDLEGRSDSIVFEGKKIDRDEAYVGRIVYAEGELPWQPEIGEPALCYDFRKDGDYFSIEQSEDEVSITKGKRITYGELINIFNIEEYKEAYDRTVRKRKSYRRKSLLYKIGILTALVFSIHGCFQSNPVKGIMAEKKIISLNAPVFEGGRKIYKSQVLYGPFRIPESEKLYNVKLKIDESIQRMKREWQSVRLMLISKERFDSKAGEKKSDPVFLSSFFKKIDTLKDPVESYAVYGDFWDEDGYDSEGYWHESDLNADSTFAIDKEGKYYFLMELFNNKPRNYKSVVIGIDQVRGYRYFVIILCLFIILWIINSVKGRSYNELPFSMAQE